MQNTKIRLKISLILSLIFYLILSFYDFAVYKDFNNENLMVLTILCTLAVIPFFLFSTFFIKNQYKVITGKVINYLTYHFWIHILTYLITIYISTTSSESIFIVSIIIKGVAIVLTKYFSEKIYEETINLSDENETTKLELTFQYATIFGLLAFILCFFLFPVIMICGKHIITYLITGLLFISVISLNYLKVKLIKSYNIVNSKRVLVFDNIVLIIGIIIMFYFSDSNLLDSNALHKSCNISYLPFIVCILMLLPTIFTNKKIGNEWTRIRKINSNT